LDTIIQQVIVPALLERLLVHDARPDNRPHDGAIPARVESQPSS
jgi:hypothetical protein